MNKYTFDCKKTLDLKDRNLMQLFLHQCYIHDGYSYDLHLITENLKKIPQFFLCYNNDEIVGCFSLFPEDKKTLTVYALVNPLHRKKGIFSSLLSLLIKTIKEAKTTYKTLEFHIPNIKIDYFEPALTILKKNDYFLSHQEYLLKYLLSSYELSKIERQLKVSTIPDVDFNEKNDEFSLYINERYVGGCFIYTPNCPENPYATIFQYGIIKSLRGKGYGKAGLYAILSKLNASGYFKVLLHVSGKNKAAHNLYTSCGFLTDSSLLIYQKNII